MKRASGLLSLLLCLGSSGISGLFAWIVKRERSWAVVTSILVMILVLGFELVEFVTQGG